MGCDGVWEVLVEGAASAESKHLHSEAGGEDWDIWMVVELFDELGLERLACFNDRCRFMMGWVPEWFGCGIVTAGEDEGVEMPDEIGCVGWDWWEDDGDTSRLVNSLGIGHGEIGGWAIFSDHEIRSNGDERTRLWG